MSSPPGALHSNKPKHFDVHHFLREVKIIVVDVGGIVILAIWIWHEVVLALAKP